MPRVLVVDDEPSILSSTAMILRGMGLEVATCDNAARILETIERVEPDVLLQDVRMPGLDLELLVFAIRKDPRWRSLPIVVFTASLEAEEVGERLKLRVIEKPFRPEILGRTLEEAVRPSA